MKHILIASGSFDRVCTQPVKKILTDKGYSVIVYEADRVAQSLDYFSITIPNNGTVTITYKKQKIDASKITAAWYRRPNIFTDNYDDPAKDESLARQYRGVQRFIWDTIPKKAWLNDPFYMRIVESNKLEQLVTAKKIGFTIPQTVISNRWNQITKLKNDKIILKMIDGVLHTQKGTKFLYTKILPNTRSSLPINTNPYPGIWQNFIEKAREWRITIVGSQVFSTAIYSHTNAKDDWRLHQFKPDYVQFKSESFPAVLQKKCLQFLKHYNLHFGVFDFIETPEGEIVFLELNPNGQYGWLEDELKLPISEAIAAELENIANNK